MRIGTIELQSLQDLITLVCKPNPHAIKDEIDQQLVFQRNKNVFFIELFSFFSMALYVFLVNGWPTRVQYASFALMLTIITVFTVSCRSYPNLFSLFYFCVLTLYGPVMLAYNSDSIFFNLVGVYILPTWMLYFSGSKLFFFAELMIQIFYMQFLYQSPMIDVYVNSDPLTYSRRIINITTYGVLINGAFLFMTHSAFIDIHKRIAAANTKKIELEKQKFTLLSLSHEIRNLLNSMLGNIQLCTLERISENVRDLLHTAEICGKLLSHVVTNILDIGKAEVGDLEVSNIPNDIYVTLEEIWNVSSQLIKNNRLKGKMMIQKNIPKMLRFDSYRLTQVLLNLVGNAVKFTESGYVNITVLWLEDEHVTSRSFEPLPFQEEGLFEKGESFALLRSDIITLDLDLKKKFKFEEPRSDSGCRGGVLKIIVTDTGSGISSTKMPNLFKSRFESDYDFNFKRMGNGLGLAVTKEVVQRLKGQIKAYSQENKGSVFMVCIPVETVRTDAPTDLSMDAFLSLVGSLELRAMVVDDIEFNTVIISNFLTKIGVKVVEVARNGKEAVTKYKSSAQRGEVLNIVTMDVEMPVMDGKEALKLIRKFENEYGLDNCLLLVVSGNCSESEVSECLDEGGVNGANHFLKKPVLVDDLAKVIKLRFEREIWARGLSPNNKSESYRNNSYNSATSCLSPS